VFTPKKILLLTIGSGSLPEPEFVKKLQEKGHQVQIRNVNEARSYCHVFHAFRLTRDIANFDLVIAQEYFCSFGICLRAMISRSDAKLAVIGFNVSRRYLTTPVGFINTAINRVFARLSTIVVHSRAERLLFSRIHHLDLNRIALALWGFDIPLSFRNSQIGSERPWDRRFVCMVGRNNRDFATLEEGLRGTSIPAIFVASRVTDPDLKGSEQIKVMYDISFDDCLRVIDHSVLSIILLKNGERGAGHITAVSAMLLGKAQVFSDAEVLNDYLASHRHGLSVPSGDPAAVRQAITTLYNDEKLCEKFAIEAREYGLTYLTNAALQRRLFCLLDATLEGTSIETVDPKWNRYIVQS
jgi:hypothetical protein